VEQDTTDLASAIGQRVKHHRQERRWTLDQLAQAAGVSRRMVVSVEQGAVNPSVGTLLRISEALGIGLPALVEPPRTTPVLITRRGSGPELWRGDAGGRGVLVASTDPPDAVVELWDWTLCPGDRHTSEAHAAGTRELLQVQDGTVHVEIGERTVVLAAGDAVSFRGDGPHAYANPLPDPARFSLTVFEPGVGSPRRTAGAVDA
jgi:transcriptional regulator with XRE-family HTH domain